MNLNNKKGGGISPLPFDIPFYIISNIPNGDVKLKSFCSNVINKVNNAVRVTNFVIVPR